MMDCWTLLARIKGVGEDLGLVMIDIWIVMPRVTSDLKNE